MDIDTKDFSVFLLSKRLKQYMKESGLNIVYETITHSGRADWIQVIAQMLKRNSFFK